MVLFGVIKFRRLLIEVTIGFLNILIFQALLLIFRGFLFFIQVKYSSNILAAFIRKATFASVGSIWCQKISSSLSYDTFLGHKPPLLLPCPVLPVETSSYDGFLYAGITRPYINHAFSASNSSSMHQKHPPAKMAVLFIVFTPFAEINTAVIIIIVVIA